MDGPRPRRGSRDRGTGKRPFAGKEESARIPRPGTPGEETAAGTFHRVLRQAGPYLDASWTMTAALLLGLGLGWWLDRRLGTGPWLMLLGILLGIVVGMYGIARVAFPPGGRR